MMRLPMLATSSAPSSPSTPNAPTNTNTHDTGNSNNNSISSNNSLPSLDSSLFVFAGKVYKRSQTSTRGNAQINTLQGGTTTESSTLNTNISGDGGERNKAHLSSSSLLPSVAVIIGATSIVATLAATAIWFGFQKSELKPKSNVITSLTGSVTRERRASGDGACVKPFVKRVSHGGSDSSSHSSGSSSRSGNTRRTRTESTPLSTPETLPAPPRKETQAKIKDLASLMSMEANGSSQSLMQNQVERKTLSPSISRALSVLERTGVLSTSILQFLQDPNSRNTREALRRETREWLSAREWISRNPSSGEADSRRFAECALAILHDEFDPTGAPFAIASMWDALIALSTPLPQPLLSANQCRICRVGTGAAARLDEFRRLFLADNFSLWPSMTVEEIKHERILLSALTSTSSEPEAFLVAPPRWLTSCPIVTWTLQMDFAMTIMNRRGADVETLFRVLDTTRIEGWRRVCVGVVLPGKGLFGRADRLASYDALVVFGPTNTLGWRAPFPRPGSPAHARKYLQLFFSPSFPARFREAFTCAVRGVPPPLFGNLMLAPPLVALLRDADGRFPKAFALSCKFDDENFDTQPGGAPTGEGADGNSSEDSWVARIRLSLEKFERLLPGPVAFGVSESLSVYPKSALEVEDLDKVRAVIWLLRVPRVALLFTRADVVPACACRFVEVLGRA